MPRYLTIAALWIVAVVLAFQFGRSTAPQSTTDTLVELSEVERAAILASFGGEVPDASTTVYEATPDAFLKLETNAEFEACFEQFLPEFRHAPTHDSLLVLADVWASTDPVAATAWLANLDFGDRRNPYVFASLSQWAGQDPDAAIAWFNRNNAEASDDRDYMLASLIRGVAEADPQRALQMLLAAPDSPERSGAMDFLLHAWTQQGIEHAFQQVVNLPASAGELKVRAIQALVKNMALADVAAVQALAAGMANAAERRVTQVAIAARWSQRAPADASAWVAGLDDSQTRKSAYGEVGARWARVDPIAASEWLQAHQAEPEFDLAARGVAWTTVGIDPDAAFAQVAAITFQPLREETFEQVGRFWIARQPETAKQFLVGDNDLPDAIRTKLLEIYE